ncbi:MAG: PVC-type heme-binding CxxCH protein [Acidobacteriota bacterium]
MRLGIVLACLLLATALAAQQTADQSLASLKSGPGLQTTLWASEPNVTNPTNLTVDERGRVWVLEAVNYRRALRTQTDIRPAGDRIVILEDTNQDGKADKVKVFDQNPEIRAPLGIAVLGNKVYVSQSPNLTVYTKDANDAIVSKEVLLTGFGGIDHDHGLHAINFGPDGRLYFNQGNTGFSVTDRSGRTLQSSSYENVPLNRPDAGFFQGVSFRMNADGTNLEVIGQNFRNPFELALDSFGNVFQTDNDDDGNAWTRLNYVMEGGNFGYFGPLHRTWNADRGGHFHNELPGVVPNILRLGGGSPTGLLVYEGKLLPEHYRGELIHAEAGKRIVAGYPLTNDGAGFGATIEEVVFGGADTWFRPSDVAVSPDGTLFVADWYDPGVGGHNMGDPQGARGRIFRVAPPSHVTRTPLLNLQTEAGLIAAFASPAQSVRYLAHQAILAKGDAATPMLQRLWHGTDATLRARALWILGARAGAGQAAIQEALKDTDPRFRILGLRVSRLYAADMLAVSAPLLHDPSPQVRREIAIQLRDANPARMIPPYLNGLQITPTKRWLDSMSELIAQYDGKDRWYLEALAIAARGREDAIYARLTAQRPGLPGAPLNQLIWALRPKTALPDLVAAMADANRPMAEREVAIDALTNMEWPEATRAVETFVANAATPPALAGRAFAAYSRQLYSLWPDARTGANVPTLVRRALAMPSTQAAAVDLIGRMLDPQYLPDLAALVKRDDAAPEARAAAVTLLATTGDAKYTDDFRALGQQAPVPVRIAAVRANAAVAPAESVSWAQTVLLSDAPNEVRVEALRLMAASPDGVKALLDLAERQQLPAEFRSLASTLANNVGRGGARGRGGFAPVLAGRAGGAGAGPTPAGAPPQPDPAIPALRERAAKVLPMPAAAAIPGIAALERNYRGNAAAGRKVFEQDAGCAACHSLGGARKLGPDLSSIGTKYGKQAILDNILRPSDSIGFEYVVSTLKMKNGETVTGIVTDSTADAIVLRVSETDERRLRAADVASRQASGVSMMPEGLLTPLSQQQVSDLLEFLSTQTGKRD